MKTKTSTHEKIATRAYFAWLAGSTSGHKADWLAAEAIETAYAERRAAAARKAAVTRKGNAMLKPPPGSKPALRTASAITAH